ncbi:hypothetical protein [Streptomyces litchfieldiae]|uniref:Carboxymuconolactone decarboxylase-like domain-containing protein n=1 Tax=Streptomyces litchfieldiae TaxID=3075543 RepID=A0ABU2MWZ3_9ACTN|nr:hypothetical protein [Streptomyces sp. DSM 44938]MDT0345084.1 hypothetical protein [Streptomyces sp. DSM 44938]
MCKPSRSPTGCDKSAGLGELAAGDGGLERFVREYLSARHRGNPEHAVTVLTVAVAALAAYGCHMCSS